MEAKKHLMSLLLLSFMSFSAQSQGYLKVNPIALSFGIVGGDFEFKVAKRTSVQFSGYQSFMKDNEIYYIGGWLIGCSGRFYVTKETGLKGGFISPNVSLRFNGTETTTSTGLLFGYQWMFRDDRVSLEIGFGSSYGITNNGRYTYSNPKAITSFSVGYRLF
jgi:Protein of unknown function (DUF3575)